MAKKTKRPETFQSGLASAAAVRARDIDDLYTEALRYGELIGRKVSVLDMLDLQAESAKSTDSMGLDHQDEDKTTDEGPKRGKKARARFDHASTGPDHK